MPCEVGTPRLSAKCGSRRGGTSPRTQVAPIVIGYAAVAIVGYQFVCDFGPVLDIGAGATAFHVPRAQVPVAGAPVSSDVLTKIYPAAKVNLGWAF